MQFGRAIIYGSLFESLLIQEFEFLLVMTGSQPFSKLSNVNCPVHHQGPHTREMICYVYCQEGVLFAHTVELDRLVIFNHFNVLLNLLLKVKFVLLYPSINALL